MTSQSKGRNLDPKDLQASPHIVYWRQLDRIGKAAAAQQDIGPLVLVLYALLEGIADEKFYAEWDALQDWDTADEQTEATIGILEKRVMELGTCTRLMRRKNMLEEASVRGRV